ncbi:hypothetical protein LXL04_003621 [Taraxacum kok-saghyz]
MRNLDPDLMKIPPDSHYPDREMFLIPSTEIGDFSDYSGVIRPNSAAIPLPSHSPNTNDLPMEYTDPATKEPDTNWCSVNRNLQSHPHYDSDGFPGYSDSLRATDAPNPPIQCSIDHAQAELKISQSNSTRTDNGYRFPIDNILTEVAISGKTSSKFQLTDNSAFVSPLYTDSTNKLSNLSRKLENAKLISPVPLNIENPLNNKLKATQKPKKWKKMYSNWMKLNLKRKIKLVNNLGASKTQMALKKSIWITRVTNLARKKYLNLDNIQKHNITINPDAEKLNEAEENHVKKGSAGPIDKKKPETNNVADKEKREAGTKEVQVPMSYADKVGKKKQMSNLIRVIKKDPKLNVGEVEMPVADIIKGSEPFNTTLYGYFIEKRVNYFNVNKYAMSKWKQFGIEEVMVNEEGFYFFRFSSEQGVIGVLEGGPWLIFTNPIIIRRWTTGLNLSKSEHNSIPVWVKVFNVPLEYWNGTGLNHIAWEIGKPLEVDSWTANMCDSHWGRPAFMRILMEMSAEKEWLKELNVFSIDMMTGERLQSKCKVEYAWTPSKCSHCKVFGHRDSSCGILIAMDLKMKATIGKEKAIQEGRKVNLIEELLNNTVKVNPSEDDFITVDRKKKKHNKNTGEKVENPAANNSYGQGQNGNFSQKGKNQRQNNRQNFVMKNSLLGNNFDPIHGQTSNNKYLSGSGNGGKGQGAMLAKNGRKGIKIGSRKGTNEVEVKSSQGIAKEATRIETTEEDRRPNGQSQGGESTVKDGSQSKFWVKSPMKQTYVPKANQNPVVSSNYDDGPQHKINAFSHLVSTSNKYAVLVDEDRMEEEDLIENVDSEDETDEEEEEVIEVTEAMETSQGVDLINTNDKEFPQ